MIEKNRKTLSKPRKGRGKTSSARKSDRSTGVNKQPGNAGKSDSAPSGSVPRRLAFGLFKWSLICSIWGGVALGAFVAWYAWDLPNIDTFEAPTRRASITLMDSGDREIATYGDLYGTPLRYADVPPHLVQAIVATEDRRFFDHPGFDPVAMLRAVITNIRAGRVREGGSTLTQQLAKNIFLKPDRTLRRKVQELLLAFWLEATFSKEQIFTLYINRVYLGSGAYGVDAAARRYFGKSAINVSLHEAAVIAGLLKAPSRYSPLRNRGAAERRARVVLGSMVAAKFLDEKTAQKIGGQRLRTVARDESQRSARYFADWALERVNGFIGRVENDLIVRTTMDARLQLLAESRVRAALKRHGRQRNISQAALVSMSTGGAVRALVGGRDYGLSQYNRAFQARRQPGSTFKLFVYLAAMENGMSPQDRLVDRPIKIGTWKPRNFGGSYEGEVTLKSAVARSINSVAVQVAERVGRQTVIDTARRLGISSPLKPHPSIALGASEVTLVELTSAYAVIASGGDAVWPHGIKEIRTRDGKILYSRQGGRTPRIVDPQTVRRMNDMLRAVVTGGTGRAANPGRPAAGKTGTSQGFRDAWFVGYTGELVSGVWMGNDDGSPMKRVSGSRYPAQLWRDYTRAALQGRPVTPLPFPPDTLPAAGAESIGGSLFFNWLQRNVDSNSEPPEELEISD